MKDFQDLIKGIIFLIASTSFACDICSCAASSATTMNMDSKSHYISLSYNYLNFKFKDGVHDNSPYGEDNIHQFNLNGQYMITNRIGVQLSVPYQKNIRNTEDGDASNIGIGDVSLNSVFTIFSHDNHKIKTGVGVKFPTGEFNYAVATVTNTTANQLGTGSLDVNIPLEYVFTRKRLTSQIKATYFYKTENNDNFKFGNQTQIQLQASYKIIERMNHSYAINIGTSYDSYLKTEIRESEINDTDGYLLNSNLGLRYETKKVLIGANYQIPLDQDLVNGEVTFKKGLGVYTYWKF